MATSLIGPLVVERALSTAPPPRPPQPTRARRIMSSPAAWTAGTTMPDSAVAAAMAVVDLRKSRRLLLDLVGWCGGCICLAVLPARLPKINRKLPRPRSDHHLAANQHHFHQPVSAVTHETAHPQLSAPGPRRASCAGGTQKRAETARR